jgi:hypothetical protein
MCDGNLRSTIKALIMANEYLEAELGNCNRDFHLVDGESIEGEWRSRLIAPA